MKKLLEYLGFCSHEWETQSIGDVSEAASLKDALKGNIVQIGKKYVLRCKKCGDIKIVKTYE